MIFIWIPWKSWQTAASHLGEKGGKQMIRINGRNTIGKPDKLFGVSALAKARIAEIGKENVINSTLGVLLDDNGKLVVLSSVMEALYELRPEEFAAYAPIIGIPEYKEAVTKAVSDEVPQDLFIETCYAPGGTGALRNAISCYSSPGDKILTVDGIWAPYNVIVMESRAGKSRLTPCLMKIIILIMLPSANR